MPFDPLDALNALAPEEVENNNMLDDECTTLIDAFVGHTHRNLRGKQLTLFASAPSLMDEQLRVRRGIANVCLAYCSRGQMMDGVPITPKLITTCFRLLALKRGHLLQTVVVAGHQDFIKATCREVCAAYEAHGITLSLSDLEERLGVWWRRFDGRLGRDKQKAYSKKKERSGVAVVEPLQSGVAVVKPLVFSEDSVSEDNVKRRMLPKKKHRSRVAVDEPVLWSEDSLLEDNDKGPIRSTTKKPIKK